MRVGVAEDFVRALMGWPSAIKDGRGNGQLEQLSILVDHGGRLWEATNRTVMD